MELRHLRYFIAVAALIWCDNPTPVLLRFLETARDLSTLQSKT
ncbi:MAG: hypothetical protein P2A85_27035 [Microcoleus anatoxicus]